MSVLAPQLQRNAPFRCVNPPKGNPFLSLKALPFLIVLASLALQPAVRAQVVATIPVGTPPFDVLGIVANPTRDEVYVADSTGHRIAFINTVSNTLEGYVNLSTTVLGLATSPDGNTLYATVGNTLLAISLVTFDTIFDVPVNNKPTFPQVSADGSTIWVPCRTTPGTVVVVGGPLNARSFSVSATPAIDAALSTDNTSLYVTALSKQITVVDTATGNVTGHITTAKPTDGLVVTGTTLYATGINDVFVIDTNTNTVTDTIKFNTTGKFLATFPAVTPDGAFVCVPVAENVGPPIVAKNFVLVIDTATNQIVQVQTVGYRPVQAACASNDIYGYTSNERDGTVSAFNLAHPPPSQ